MSQNKKMGLGLGRGLDALIQMDEVRASGSSSISEIAIEQITANPNQPRLEFDEQALKDLATSIEAIGIVQPITLRETGNNSYQIIAGERRYRASKMAGKKTIPAYVRKVEDETVVEMALIENIQREDLNAIEIALTYQKLIEQYGLTQEKLSERVGKSRAAIANYLRLLKLPAEIQVGLTNKAIDMGHARALLPLPDAEAQLAIYDTICSENLSVRKVEELVKGFVKVDKGVEEQVQDQAAKSKTADFDILRNHLSSFFQTNVQLVCNDKGKGKISIAFKSDDELERIIGIFDKLQQ